MDKDFEIELQSDASAGEKNIQLPMNFLTFGEIESDDVKIYIKQDVYKALEKLSASDTSTELGSIIIGDYSQDLGKTSVIISNYVEAKYTDASASTLTFTHETWEYVHTQHEKLYPDKKIIGWQHTHPNYGIFLSNYDLFIQENFFNLPFQVAYVIDPIQKIRGFFQWKNGKIEKIKGYYVYDDIGKPIKIEQSSVKPESSQPKTPKLVAIVIAFLIIATAVLSFSVFSLGQKYKEQMEKQNQILDQLVIQKEVTANQSELITMIQERLANDNADNIGDISAADIIEILESHGIVFQNREKVLSELNGDADSQNIPSEEVEFTTYTVEEGDTLGEICMKHGIDYKTNISIILEMSGIKNPNLIYAGQKIMLPAKATPIE